MPTIVIILNTRIINTQYKYISTTKINMFLSKDAVTTLNNALLDNVQDVLIIPKIYMKIHYRHNFIFFIAITQ